MSRIRFVLLCLLTGLVTSISAPTMASAREYVVNKKPVEGVSEEYKGFQLPFSRSTVEAKLKGTRAGIVCFSITSRGFLEKEGKSKGEIFLSNCGVFEYTGGKRVFLNECTFPNRPAYKLVYEGGKLPAGEGEPIRQEWTGSEAGKLFGAIEIGVCGLKGKYELKGTQDCAWPEPLVEQEYHVWECNAVGSDELELQREGAELVEARFWYLAYVFVKTGDKWGVK